MADFRPEAKQDYAVQVRRPVVADLHHFTRQAVLPRVERQRARQAGVLGRPHAGTAHAMFVTRDNQQHTNYIERYYRVALRAARSRVVIANAYFFPGYRFIREMRRAPKRGVDVRLILQGQPDMPIVRTAASLLYDHLLRAGVRIYEYCDRPLHGKVALVDEAWATVGSSNLDPLSLSLNLEANLIIHDRQFNQTLRDNLQALIVNDCVRVDESMVPKRTWWNLGISVVVFHFLRHFPAMVGWLPAHTPKLAQVDPPVQPEMETQDRIEAEDGGKP